MQEAVKRAVDEHTGTNTPIVNCAQLVDSVLEGSAVDVNARQVRQVLKQDLGFSYRRVRLVTVQSNSVRCRVMRQQYALKML